MPLVNNPQVQSFLTEHGMLPSNTLHALGLGSLTQSRLPDVVRMPGTMEANPAFRLGEAAGSALENRRFLEPIGRFLGLLGSNNGASAALVSALFGAAGGAGFGALTRRDPLAWGALGAGVAGLGGLGIQQFVQARDRQRRRKLALMGKQAFYVSNEQDPLVYIQQRLFEDRSLDSGAHLQLTQQLRQVSPQDLVTLADLLRTVAGGAVGYIVARFLLNAGGAGTMLLTGLGGLAGASMRGSGQPRNAFGQSVDTQRDVFGRSRFVL